MGTIDICALPPVQVSKCMVCGECDNYKAKGVVSGTCRSPEWSQPPFYDPMTTYAFNASCQWATPKQL